MRILKFLALTGILLVTSAFDTFKATFPAICAPSKNAFKEFKEHNYRPILVGNDDEKVLMVFVSDENAAIVTYSVQEKGITCIIGMINNIEFIEQKKQPKVEPKF